MENMEEEKKEEKDILTESEGEKTTSTENDKDKKIKNLTALAILLGGLFVGSLFVDIAQLIKGEGFSQKKLSEVNVVEVADKSWVAYSDPIVNVKVITDDECEVCDPSEVLVWLRRVIPTVAVSKIDENSEEGQELIEEREIKTLPAFVFSESVEETDFFTKAAIIFDKKDNSFVLNTSELGLPVGKYLELPEVTEKDIQVGNKEAKVVIVEFSDFQCPYCQLFHESVKKTIDQYGDQVNFVYKHLPLNFHLQARNAALASECANEQGKFIEYADNLFAKQEDWGKTEGTNIFKTYARQTGLKSADFNQCLDEERYAEKVEQDLEEAKKFGISGTPSLFINDQFKNGVVSFEEMKVIIEEELAKE